MLLKIEAARSGHADVEHQAARAIEYRRLDQLARRSVTDRLDTHREHEFSDRGAPLLFLVADEDERGRFFRQGAAPVDRDFHGPGRRVRDGGIPLSTLLLEKQ